jgi:hypothetical protein
MNAFRRFVACVENSAPNLLLPAGTLNIFCESIVCEKDATTVLPFPGFSSDSGRRALLAGAESFERAEQRK